MRHVKRSSPASGWLELSAGPLFAAVSALALTVQSGSAEAQSYRSYKMSRYYDDDDRDERYERPRSARRSETRKPQPAAESKSKQPAPAPVNGPLLITVNLRKQTVTVHSNGGEVARSPISSGQSGYETPTGIFSIIQKNKEHYSNLYDDAPMPNMQRITWSGVALHAGNLPGYPASHGCIRLPMSFSERLFGMTQMNTRVIVSRDDLSPVPFAHKLLFSPIPAEVVANAPVAAGVQTASLAETVPEPAAPARTPSTLAAQRAVEKARLAAELKARQDEHAAALERLKTAAIAAESARGDLRELRQETERARRKAYSLASQRSGQALRIAEIGRKIGEQQLASGRTLADAINVRIEGRILDELNEVELLTAEAADIAAEAEDAARTLAEHEQARKAAQGEAAAAADRLKASTSAQAQFAREEARRNLPISVFVSRSAGKLYVRQGFEPVLEAPVTIREPNAALGTHVFTAMAFGESKSSLVWKLVTVTDAPNGSGKKGGSVSAAAALERVEIAAETRERIEDLVKPGSSLIISDLPTSHETGKGTDFVLLTR